MVNIVLIILFIVTGILLSFGKCSFLIAGFNTMSKQEKQNYDVLALSQFMGKFMFVTAFCIFLFMLSDILMMPALFTIGMILLIISGIFVLVYTNTGNRFKK